MDNLNRTVRIEAKDRRIIIHASFRDKETIKSVPGHRWDSDGSVTGEERVWHVPLSWATMQQLRGVFGDRLEIGPDLANLAWQVKELRVDPAMALREAADAPGDDRLTPLQRAGVAFMATAQQALNADPMGAGKTPQTILALKALEEAGHDVFPALVVCPNGVKVHWRDEVATWWPEKSVSVIKGGAAARRKALEEEAYFYVINWESLRAHTRLSGYGNIKLSDKEKELKELNSMGIRTVVADEAHRAKSPRAKQTRALWAVGDAAVYRYALTGTPVANTPEDLWAVMRFVSPDEYPSKVAWIDRYGLLSWNPFGGMDVVGIKGETREELFRFLDPRFLRRPKELILPDLRDKLPTIVRTVELPAKQRKPYDQLRKEMLAELDEGVLMATNPMTRMLRLRQLCGATGDFDEDGNITLKDPSAKVDELVELLEEAPDDQVVVFAQSKPLIKLAAARLAKLNIDHGCFTGDETPDIRERHRKAFQSGEIRVILCTYDAGSEGVNLSAADMQIKLELHWSSIKNQQAEERAHRMGGKDTPLKMVEVVAADTVDDRVRRVYGTKLGMMEEVVRDEESLRRLLAK